MQTSETHTLDSKLERIGNILWLVGWIGFWVQLGFAAAAFLTLMFALTGRSFTQAVTPAPTVGVVNYSQGTPGLGIGTFWAICGILLLLFSVFLAFRQTRFAKRLRNSNSGVHPKKAEIIQILRVGVITGLVGMLLTILGGGTTLAVLLAKSVSIPQGVPIYDPNRFIRSIDIFVALANMNGITAHFAGTVASLGVLNWLQRE